MILDSVSQLNRLRTIRLGLTLDEVLVGASVRPRHAPLPLPYTRHVAKRLQHPLSQLLPALRRVRAVEKAEDAEALLAAALAADHVWVDLFREDLQRPVGL